MAHFEIPTFKATWMPSGKGEHENDADAVIDAVSTEVNHKNKPKITNGSGDAWTDYAKLTNAAKDGLGIFQESWTNGSVKCSWGNSGSKHSEIFQVGTYNDCRWMPYVKGCGFKVFRHRTDSDSFTNNNANQHCIFIKRFGMRFQHRTNDETRFWSSSVLNTDGEARGHTYPYKGGVATDEFYQIERTDIDNYRDWLVDSFWVNLCSKDTSKAGTANTDVYIYNLRFYYDSQAGNNRIVQPAFRDKDSRDEPMFSL